LRRLAVTPLVRFQPIARLGGNQTGEVWRTHDSQTGQEVAYKVVAPSALPSAATLARAEREFRQLMRVSSPKVAAIVDCEKTPTGGLAVAMELCQGDSLDRILAAGPVAFERAKSIVSQVGQALLEAQKVGLVHRDVAPKNILVAPSGDVKVINFPLAVPIDERVSGVPAYLSPEQVQGKPVDQRSNTYSLAAILYHLLAGEPPFTGASAQAVLEMQVSSPVLPPTQRRPDANLPADADKLLLKALDKSSSRRHLTLRLFLNELEALKMQPIGASKPSGEVGLAKTMMFGGNQAEIARMVAEARAAKAAAGGPSPAAASTAAVPAAAPVSATPPQRPLDSGQTVTMGATASPHAAPHAQPLATRAPAINAQGQAPQMAYPAQPVAHSKQPTPAPFAPTPPPVAVQRPMPASMPPMAQSTMIQMNPAAAQPVVPAKPAVQPAPAQPAVHPGEAGKGAPPKAGSAFRETLWFKQGDVEQMVADAKAKLQAGKATTDVPAVSDDGRPLEDRYVDDGSVTVEDRKKFSLRTGGTSASIPASAIPPSVDHIDEKEMVGEISGGRRTLILIIAAVVILALVVVVSMMFRGKSKSATNESLKPAATAVATAQPDSPLPPSSPNRAFAAVDSGIASGPAAPPGATSSGKTGAPGLGTAGGATKNGLGGATGGTKSSSGTTKKPAIVVAAKKKPAPVKHPAKQHKR
jgi:serine/threonine-protein kinase